MTDLGEQASVDKANAKISKDEDTRKLVLSTLMKTVDGRRYVWLELQFMQAFQQSAVFGDNAALATYFNEGRRSVGQRLLALLTTHCATQYIQMLQENGAEEE